MLAEKSHKYLFAFDLDGTLVHPQDPEARGVPPSLLKKVFELANVHPMVIATGRRYRAAQVEIDILPKMPFHVVHNGLVIKDQQGRTVLTHELPSSIALETAALLEENGWHPFIVSDGAEYETDYSFTERALTQSPYLRYVQNRPGQTAAIVKEFSHIQHPVLEVALLGDYEQLIALREKLQPKLHSTLKAVIVKNIGASRPLSAMEIFDRRYSKWTSVQWVAQKLGCSQIVAAGDDGNDSEMIEFADVGICMAHADEHLRTKAKVVVEGPVGLERWIEGFLRNEKG